MSRTRLEWAQWMVTEHEGMEAFIARVGSKRPVTGRSWKEYQTHNPEKLAEWFEQFPNCNWGVYPGDGYAFVDLDVGAGKNGIAEFDKICEEHGIEDFRLDLPTLMVRTPSSGYHLYFKVPFGVANKNNFPNGIDVRGALGYVIGPGSEIDGVGGYEVLDESSPIMDAPDWLVEKYLIKPGQKDPNHRIPLVELDQPDHIAQAENWITGEDPAIEGEEGDHHTFVICCGVRDFGISEDECYRVLIESGWNDKCEPPWDSDGLEQKIENSYRYAENRNGNRSEEYKVQRLQRRPQGGFLDLSQEQLYDVFHPKSLIDQMMAGELKSPEPEDDEIPDNVPLDENDIPLEVKKEESEKWFGFEDFIKQEKIREYLISDWLLAHGITGVIAARGTGKSVLALDIACRIATDRDWWGVSTLKNWCVIYMCGEDEEGMIVNGRAWAKHYGEIPSNDRFLVCNEILSLAKSKEVQETLDYMKKWVNGRRCIIILDTWQRATAGVGNKEDEIIQAIKRGEYVARELRGPLLACYHPPKDGRMTVRNSAVQEDTSTVLWHLTEETDGIKLSVDRIKGAGKGNWRKFTFKKIEIGGKDEHGKPIEGIVPIKFAGTEEADKPGTIESVRNRKIAWAKAVRGCIEFPLEDNSIDAMKSPIQTHIVNMLVNMWEKGSDSANTEETKTDEQSFVKRYMEELKEHDLKTVNTTSVTKAISEIFFNPNSFEEEFEDGKKLIVEGKKIKIV